MALWTPANLANSKAWYVSDNPSNTVAGSVLTDIADKGGGGYTATNYNRAGDTGAAYGSATLNSRPVWTANNGTRKGAFGADAGGVLSNAASGITMFCVHRLNGETGNGEQVLMFFSRGDSAGSARTTLERSLGSVGDIGQGGRRLDTDGYQQIVSGTNNGAGWMVGAAVVDYANALSTVWVDGASVVGPTAFQAAGNTSATNAIRMSLGHYDVAAGNTLADYAEMIFIRGALSTTDRQLVEGYLAWQWGLQGNLPSGHPYNSAAPATNLSLTVSQTGAQASQVATMAVVSKISAAQAQAQAGQVAAMAARAALASAKTSAAFDQVASLAGVAKLAAAQTVAQASQISTLLVTAVRSLAAAQTVDQTAQVATLAATAKILAAQTGAPAAQIASIASATLSLAAMQALAPASQAAFLAAVARIRADQVGAPAAQASTLLTVAVVLRLAANQLLAPVKQAAFFNQQYPFARNERTWAISAEDRSHGIQAEKRASAVAPQNRTIYLSAAP